MLIRKLSNEEKNNAIKGITLLSGKEYETSVGVIPMLGKRFWLQSPARFDYPNKKAAAMSALVGVVGANNKIGDSFSKADTKQGVRPALLIDNSQLKLNVNEKVVINELSYTVISDTKIVCDSIIGNTAFNRSAAEEKDCVFENSDIKEWLGKWLDNEQKKHEITIKLNDITLPSKEEIEKWSAFIPSENKWYWLRTQGKESGVADIAGKGNKINGYGDDVDNKNGVRPLVLFDTDGFEPLPGAKLIKNDVTYTVISSGVMIADKIVGSTHFCAVKDSDESNDYIKSDVKIWLNDWAEKEFGSERSDHNGKISVVIQNTDKIREKTAAEENAVVEEVAVTEESPVAEEAAVVEEAPVAEKVAVVEETMAAEEVPVVEETSVVEEVPAEEATTAVEEETKVEEATVAEAAAAVEELLETPREFDENVVAEEKSEVVPDTPVIEIKIQPKEYKDEEKKPEAETRKFDEVSFRTTEIAVPMDEEQSTSANISIEEALDIPEITVPAEAARFEEAPEIEELSKTEETSKAEETTSAEEISKPEEVLKVEEESEPEKTSKPEETLETETAAKPEEAYETETAAKPEEAHETETAAKPEEALETEEASKTKKAPDFNDDYNNSIYELRLKKWEIRCDEIKEQRDEMYDTLLDHEYDKIEEEIKNKHVPVIERCRSYIDIINLRKADYEIQLERLGVLRFNEKKRLRAAIVKCDIEIADYENKLKILQKAYNEEMDEIRPRLEKAEPEIVRLIEEKLPFPDKPVKGQIL